MQTGSKAHLDFELLKKEFKETMNILKGLQAKVQVAGLDYKDLNLDSGQVLDILQSQIEKHVLQPSKVDPNLTILQEHFQFDQGLKLARFLREDLMPSLKF